MALTLQYYKVEVVQVAQVVQQEEMQVVVQVDSVKLDLVVKTQVVHGMTSVLLTYPLLQDLVTILPIKSLTMVSLKHSKVEMLAVPS